MAKNIKFKVIDQNTLELIEDAKAGDRIVLSEVLEVDASPILRAIEENRDNVYRQKLDEVKKAEQDAAKFRMEKVEAEYKGEIKELKAENKNLEDNMNLQITNDVNAKTEEFKAKIAQLEQQINAKNTKAPLVIGIIALVVGLAACCFAALLVLKKKRD